MTDIMSGNVSGIISKLATSEVFVECPAVRDDAPGDATGYTACGRAEVVHYLFEE